MPLLKDKDDQLSIILRQTPQPWHASSTLVHQAALAVSRLAPEKFWEFSYALFDASSQLRPLFLSSFCEISYRAHNSMTSRRWMRRHARLGTVSPISRTRA